MTHKLIFVGDVVMNTKPRFSPDVQAALRGASVVSCNVEAPLRGYGKPCVKTGPVVDQHPNASDWLLELGFNLFSLANNHIADFGPEALLTTKEAFPKGTVIGAGNVEEAYGLQVRVIDGVRYGFLAYGENGYGALNGDNQVGHAWVNKPGLDDDIRTYKTQVDLLVVQVHAGVELLDVPIPEWRSRFRAIIDSGADLIVAHHPHVVQGVEYYKEKAICYSLGNFYFDYPSNHPEWNKGAMLTIDVVDQKIQNIHFDIVEKKADKISFCTAEQSRQKMMMLNEKLLGEGYQDYVDQHAVLLWNRYHKAYYAKVANGLVDYSLKGILKHIKRVIFNKGVDYNMLWHNLFIESNIWLVQRATSLLKK
ncbi:MAG: CapA family protein [Sphingobacterium sp.]|jgi:poly-gamma-glutamate synthesis protein (capsule biosynthesis protein)|nr:CapA family protein [Sphingobacterium sp.]